MTDSHEIAERSRLLSHRLYAEQIRLRPELLDPARGSVQAAMDDGSATVGEQLWHHVLRMTLDEIVDRMLAESEAGRLLRSNSPFSRIIGVRDPATRARLWQQARTEASALPTSTARSAA